MTDYVQVLTTTASEEEAGRIAAGLVQRQRAAYDAVEVAIREVHSYDEPEIVATPIVAGSAGYLAWIGENVDA